MAKGASSGPRTATGAGTAVSVAAAAGGDPRMPSAARKYIPGFERVRVTGAGVAVAADDDLPPVDLPSMLGIVVGVAGVMLKQKVFCWMALLLAAQALANMRSADSDLKQILCCLSFAVMGLVSAYFGPTHPAAAATAGAATS